MTAAVAALPTVDKDDEYAPSQMKAVPPSSLINGKPVSSHGRRQPHHPSRPRSSITEPGSVTTLKSATAISDNSSPSSRDVTSSISSSHRRTRRKLVDGGRADNASESKGKPDDVIPCIGYLGKCLRSLTALLIVYNVLIFSTEAGGRESIHSPPLLCVPIMQLSSE